MANKYYRINQYIQANTVRVLGEDGKQLGVMPLSEALALARSKEIDLVEIAHAAQPPVCRIIDFNKFKFLEQKKEQESKKKAKQVEIKELRVRPFIAENDLNTHLKRAEGFLAKGNKVKVTIVFRGRENTKKGFGFDLVKKISGRLSGHANPEGEPKAIGRFIEISYAPIKNAKNNEKEEVKS